MLRCGRFSCTSTRDDDGDDDHDDNHDDDVDVDIADDTKVSFLGLFNSPPENVWKVTTVASLTDARHLVFLKVASGGNGILGLDKLARGLYICGSYLSIYIYIYMCVCASFQFFAETAQVSNIKIHNQSIHSIFGDFTVNSLR